jgi:hypothetical protein
METARSKLFSRGSLCALLNLQFFPLFVVISIGMLAGLGMMTGCKSSSKPKDLAGGAASEAPRDSLELVFTYGSEKEKWIKGAPEKPARSRW